MRVKVSCAKDVLRDALKRLGQVIPTRTTMPILGGVEFRADGKLTVRATSLDSDLSLEVAADVSGEGSVVLPYRYIDDLVDRLPRGDIEIEVGGAASIRWPGGAATLNRLDGELPTKDEKAGAGYAVDLARLGSGVQAASVAASQDQARVVLTGIRIRIGQ